MINPYENPKTPKLTVDAWIRDGKGRLLLVQRGRPPFVGHWGLPGGFCEWGETTEACRLAEEIEDVSANGMLAPKLHARQLPASKLAPESTLRVRGAVSQLPRAGQHVSVLRRVRHRLSPHPDPLPEGEGVPYFSKNSRISSAGRWLTSSFGDSSYQSRGR